MIQDERGPLYIATVRGTKLDDIAAKTYHATPDGLARLGFAIARELSPDAPATEGLSEDEASLAQEITVALKGAQRPVVIAGTSLGNESLVKAAANITWALCVSGKPAGLCYTVPECNTLGLGLMGGKGLDDSFKMVQDGKADAVFILENDLFRRADEKSVHDFLNKARHVITLDHLINPTSSKAQITLPVATFAEANGTLINNEGRAQRFYQVFTPNLDIEESWKWIRDISAVSGRNETNTWRNFDDIVKDMAAALEIFKPVLDLAPPADFRVFGTKIPREPHRYSGRTAMLANISVHEPRPADDPDTPLSFSMEGYEGQPPAALISRYWSPGWNSVSALNKFQQELGGPLTGGDPGKRLIEPKPGGKPGYFTSAPSKALPGQEQTPPQYDIFKSEELSAQSPAIIERAKNRNNPL
jgi:NADH-quinone oxidoreductase subunit G